MPLEENILILPQLKVLSADEDLLQGQGHISTFTYFYIPLKSSQPFDKQICSTVKPRNSGQL